MRITESLAIGAISSFFGRRYGVIGIHKLISSLGLYAPYGNKQQRIDHILKELYLTDKKDFKLFLKTLIDNHKLSVEDRFQLNQSLGALGYTFTNDQLKDADKTEIIYSESRPFDAFIDIKKIMANAEKEIKIIDPYIDQGLFTLYLSDVKAQVDIKILSKKVKDKVKAVAKVFKKQKNNFEIRSTQNIHDRYIIVDNRAWIIGQSIKDAGNKPLSIIELRDPSNAQTLFSKLWENSEHIS